jgi:cytochrome P450
MSSSRLPRLPPGPKRRPLLGSLPELSRDPLGLLDDLAFHYGPIAYTTIGPSRLYLINEPELIEEALIGRARDCIKDPGTRELIPLVGHGLLTSEGELWRRQRKLASPALSPKRIAGYADTMVDCARRAFAELPEGERDVSADMMRLTLEIVSKTLLGVDARAEADRIAHVVDVAMVYFDKQLRTWRGILPKWIPTPDRIAFRKVLPELDAIIGAMIARCRAGDAEADHLLARLVQARDEDGQPMSDAQVRDEAVTMLLAGHETTALTLSFAGLALARDPAAAQRARDEVDALLGARPATIADLPRLPFVEAVVKEALRLYPPAWIIGREVLRPFELGGYTLPAKVELVMSPYTMQRDPRFFHEPTRFAPERWLEPAIEALPRFAYFPFGGGPRVCIGNHFAMMEATLVLATLLQQLELSEANGYRLELAPVVTLRPAHGIRLRVARRRAGAAAAQ